MRLLDPLQQLPFADVHSIQQLYICRNFSRDNAHALHDISTPDQRRWSYAGRGDLAAAAGSYVGRSPASKPASHPRSRPADVHITLHLTVSSTSHQPGCIAACQCPCSATPCTTLQPVAAPTITSRQQLRRKHAVRQCVSESIVERLPSTSQALAV